MNPPNQQPSPSEALALLDRAAANVAATRADHVNLQICTKILADYIEAHRPNPALEDSPSNPH